MFCCAFKWKECDPAFHPNLPGRRSAQNLINWIWFGKWSEDKTNQPFIAVPASLWGLKRMSNHLICLAVDCVLPLFGVKLICCKNRVNSWPFVRFKIELGFEKSKFYCMLRQVHNCSTKRIIYDPILIFYKICANSGDSIWFSPILVTFL